MNTIETIRAEIERQRQSIEGLFTEGDNSFYDGLDDAYYHILAFLGALPEQPASEELEEEIERFYCTDEYRIADTLGRGFETLARHFAEWGAEHLKK